MGEIAVVAFDVDDTLYLERDYVRSGFAVVGRELDERFSCTRAADVLWRRFVDGERGTVFDSALDELGVPAHEGLISELVTLYRRHRPAISMLPDAEACIEALKDLVSLAVISDGPLESQRAKTEALALDRRVSLIVLTAELGVDCAKPAHDAFALVERTFSVAPGACAYVADNPAKDFVAPLERGWTSVRVRRQSGLHHAVELSPEVLEVPDLWGLPSALEIA